MTLRYLLDTNVISEPLRAVPNVGVMTRLDRHAEEIATASVVWHELLFGLAALPQGKKRRAGERFLQQVVGANMPILSYDLSAASWHAQERARLVSVGQTPPFIDGQIAAIAVANGLTLVTANVRDFHSFRELQVERWHS